MIVKHIEVRMDLDTEHRVVVAMTALEARLFLNAQSFVLATIRDGISAALSECDQRPKRR